MPTQAILLEIWREVCRHVRMEESLGSIAAMLSPLLPVRSLSVLAFDPVAGTAISRGGPFTPPARLQGRTGARPGPGEIEGLQRWTEAGEPLLLRAGTPHPMPAPVLGVDPDRDWILVPLTGDEGSRGILVLELPRATVLDDARQALARDLIEPLSAALENDHRLHALSALREAAEAGKRSALSRLGREELTGAMIGADGGLQRVMERVGLVAGSDLAVLIIGETGSGKEVIARAIHERSHRATGPFIRVNCGAISPELIDSELFGHEKGAFTGATANRRGWFERADGGTLLLDEIGELPLPAQVRLLRVVQEGVFERVGGERSIHVDVRIVAATHRDLPGMVQQGRFREDLWYRITGFQMLLPPLRERQEDIPALARHFIDRACRRFGTRPPNLSEDDLELLRSYPWPGNVREFASVIDRAVILGAGGSLHLAQALGSVPSPGAFSEGSAVVPSAPRPTTRGGIATLDQAMRTHIEAALGSTRGRIEGDRGAARLLGINPHTLRARMRKLGIAWGRFRDA